MRQVGQLPRIMVRICLFIYVEWKQAVGLSTGTVVTVCHALIMGSSQVTWKVVRKAEGIRYVLTHSLPAI